MAHGSSQTRGRIKAAAASNSTATQCQSQAASSTYTTVHGNAGSLTPWLRPGIKLTSSWIRVGFVTIGLCRELLSCAFWNLFIHCFLSPIHFSSCLDRILLFKSSFLAYHIIKVLMMLMLSWPLKFEIPQVSMQGNLHCALSP